MINESARRSLALAESTGACKNHELVVRILEKHGCFAQQTQQAVLAVAQPVTPTVSEKPAKGPRKASKGKAWNLARVLYTVGRTVCDKPSNYGSNCLSNALLRGNTITATDYDLTAVVTCPDDFGVDGYCVPARELPKEFNGLTFDTITKRVNAGAVSLLSLLPVADYPAIDKVDPGTLPVIATLTRQEIDGLTPCMSDDPARMNLNGIFLTDGAAVATDGHRLTALESPLVKGRAVVHRSFFKAVLAFGVDSIEVRQGQGEVCAIVPLGDYSLTLWARQIDEEYPNYAGVISKSCKCKTTINRASIDAIAKQPKDNHSPQVIFESGKAYKSSERVSWSLPVAEFALTDIEKVAYNPSFLDDLPSEVQTWEAWINGTDCPSMFKAGKWTAIVMPMDIP